MSLLCALACHAVQPLRISEVLFNPPGSLNIPDQYIEIQGQPNAFLIDTYFVAVEGDTNGNPGSIENVFDLSGHRLGGNGFLVVLQNSNRYSPGLGVTVLGNTNGPGFGHGSSSTASHRGKNGQVTLPTASATFLLLQSTNAPRVGDDIDSDNDGIPDGEAYASWVVLDSVGVLDNDGPGDVAYGRINFRRNGSPGSQATAASGLVVPVDFTPAYIARVRNSTNWTSAEWMAADLLGAAPKWMLDRSHTTAPTISRKPLVQPGLPNFRAPALPGVIVGQPAAGVCFKEGGSGRYTLGLNVKAAKGLYVELASSPGFELSGDGGKSYSTNAVMKLTSTRGKAVMVRVANDTSVGRPERSGLLTHRVVGSADLLRYPTNETLIPPALLVAEDDERVLISEVKVNPPGTDDGPYELVELMGTPGVALSNVLLLALHGDVEIDPGVVAVMVDLHGHRLGSNGLLLVVAPGHPYQFAPGTAVVEAPAFAQPAGALPNGTLSLLLLHTTNQIALGTDLDVGNNGTPEKLPLDAAIIDSVAWDDGDKGDAVYSSAVLKVTSGAPDAASRFVLNPDRNSAAAWFAGDLAGTNGASLVYNGTHGTTNFPVGSVLSPGVTNNSAPLVLGLHHYACAIGDSTRPPLTFTISDAEAPVSTLSVSVRSSNTNVLPNSGLALSGNGSHRTLVLNPAGQGYSTVTVSVSDGALTAEHSFEFAATRDLRGGGLFHSGASDASTAYLIDSRWMIVGDDENQRLRLYSRTDSGPTVKTFEMNPYLDLRDLYPDGSPKEMDIEGSAFVENRIFWIGSHSHANDAEIRTNRARIFATDIVPDGTNTVLTFAGRYDYFKADLLNWDAHDGHGKGNNYYGLYDSSREGVDPKDTNGIGFNIEGLAMAPNDANTAYVSFRSPLVPPSDRINALIIPVTNFASLAVSGAEPGAARFGVPIELNLGGRGIRSIDCIGTNYLIVAGPPGPASFVPPSDFKLFTWSGDPNDPPRQRAADLSGLNPEGIVAMPPLPWTASSKVQIMSDNGVTDFYGDGTPAKLLPIRDLKLFRTDWIRLGDVVTPEPYIRSVVVAEGSTLKLRWHSAAGVRYRIQAKAALFDTWTDTAHEVTATEAITSQDLQPSATERFFRVVAQP